MKSEGYNDDLETPPFAPMSHFKAGMCDVVEIYPKMIYSYYYYSYCYYCYCCYCYYCYHYHYHYQYHYIIDDKVY